MTMTQMRNVKRNGLYVPGVNWPSSVVSMAPAMPTTAEPKMNTCRWRAVMFLPIAPAEISLSRMARIMRPHGAFNAALQRIKMTINTAANNPAYISLTNKLE